jgi:hypothetical protein
MTDALGKLILLSNARSRSISAENFTGEKGKGGMAEPPPEHPLGRGWKVSPSIVIEPGATFTLADIDGPGTVQQIWITVGSGDWRSTFKRAWRHTILRVYWDDQEQPSVECPIGDFFAMGWGRYAQLSSLAVCVNPGSAFNCYWQMPFRGRARFTLENIDDVPVGVYYQLNYELDDVPDDAAYFHAQFRRVNPLPYMDVHTVLDGVEGRGQYAGTYVAWGSNNDGWWGEGEMKFYLDGDEWPTICGTGTEDYFCGSYNFENQETGRYQEFTTPYAGLHQVLRPDGLYRSQQRFGMYRWHVTDPIRFQQDLRVTLQGLGVGGWHDGRRRFVPLQDDIASVAYWYQTLPTQPFPQLPDRERLEVN